MKLELTCYPLIRSCVNCAAKTLVSPGEVVYIYTHPGQFTDMDYQGWVRATVLSALEDCGCYNYILELFEEDLPEGIANLALCDIANIGCEPCASDLTLSAGTATDNQLGGTSEVQGLLHVWSETLGLLVTEFGRLQIELPAELLPGDESSIALQTVVEVVINDMDTSALVQLSAAQQADGFTTAHLRADVVLRVDSLLAIHVTDYSNDLGDSIVANLSVAEDTDNGHLLRVTFMK